MVLQVDIYYDVRRHQLWQMQLQRWRICGFTVKHIVFDGEGMKDRICAFTKESLAVVVTLDRIRCQMVKTSLCRSVNRHVYRFY
jgi:hypothetical protein